MKTFKKLIIFMILLSLSIFQTGCWDKKIYEKIGFILQLGLELNDEGHVQYTAGVPLVAPESKGRIEILTTTVNLMREGRDKLRQVSGKTLEGGKVQHIYFSEALAQRGISELLEIFVRSPENPLLSNLIVVEGSPNELIRFSEEYGDKPRPAMYVNDLLENARNNSYAPEARISHFTILTHSGSIDPVTTLFRYTRKEIQVAGTALFSGDKMVGKINTKDTALLLALMGESKNIGYVYQGAYSRKEDDNIKSGAAVLMKSKDRKIDINIKGDKATIDIKLNLKASLGEYSGELDLSNQQDKKKLEEAVAESIEKDCLKLLKYLVEVGSDPVGFREIIRTKHNQYWKSMKWNEVYKNAAFNVDAKVKFEFYGAISNQ